MDDIDHVSYEKMPHSSSKWKFAQSSKPNNVKWCVTEKCHGANFCFHCNGKEIFCAKRTALILPNESFFGYESIANQLRQNIFLIYETIATHKNFIKRYIGINRLDSISVYGEIFGGFYPVSNKNKQTKNEEAECKTSVSDSDVAKPAIVQREILYSPNIEFYAFDIAVTVKDLETNAKPRRQYLNYEDSLKIFEMCQLFHAKPLFIGKLEDCCNYSHEFQSQIPKWLGLPLLPQEYGSNFAEGIVIKPMKNIYIESKGKRLKRPIVKHKNKAFDERVTGFDSKYGQFDNRKNGKDNEFHLNGKDVVQLECILAMINKSRYQSIISKYGNPNSNSTKKKKQKGKKKQAVNEDCYNFYSSKMVEDVVDDIEQNTESVIYQWWQSNVNSNEKMGKYIDQKMMDKAKQIIKENCG